MPLDILAYELKYKNDPMVMELVAAYKALLEAPLDHDEFSLDGDDL